MTINVALGANSVAPQARSNDRTARSATTEGARFDDALSDKQPKRKDEDTSAQETAHPRAVWSIDKLTAQIGVDGGQPEAALPESDAEFEAVLDQLLGAPVEPDVANIDANAAVAVQLPDRTTKAEATNTSLAQPGEDAAALDQSQKLALNPLQSAQSANLGDSVEDGKTASQLAGVVAGPAQDTQQPDKRRTAARAAQPGVVAGTGPVAADKATTSSNAPQSPDTERLADTDAARPRNRDLNQNEAGAQKAAAFVRDGSPSAAKVNVLSFSASLPPVAQTTLGTTSAGLVSALESDPTWRSAAHDSAQMAGNRAPNSTAGVNTLRIQLNPAELGMVTARLTASGQQLSVEVQVENSEAHHKLSRDGDAILKALRAVGYDVERITITQSSQTNSGNLQNGASSRDQFLQNPQSQSDGNAENRRSGDENFGRESEGATHVSSETAAARAGGDIYI